MTIPKGTEAKPHVNVNVPGQKTNVFGYVHVYEHEHVLGSTIRLLVDFASHPKDTHLHKSVTNYRLSNSVTEKGYTHGERRPFRTKELPLVLYYHRRAPSYVAVA
jgi:hypothetical protein